MKTFGSYIDETNYNSLDSMQIDEIEEEVDSVVESFTKKGLGKNK